MSKERNQGTKFESWVVGEVREAIPDGWAERLAEGGEYDLGDVRILDALEDEWIVECKAREKLNVTRVLANAKSKSGIANTVLAWKRLTKNPGGGRRTPDGEPVVVVMDFSTFLGLLGAHPDD